MYIPHQNKGENHERESHRIQKMSLRVKWRNILEDCCAADLENGSQDWTGRVPGGSKRRFQVIHSINLQDNVNDWLCFFQGEKERLLKTLENPKECHAQV